MNEKKEDCTNFTRKQNILECEISGKKITIDVFFNMRCVKLLNEYYEKYNSFKKAFSGVVFYMYSNNEAFSSDQSLQFEDFISANNEELYVILQYILNEDEKIRSEYLKIESENIFERFYQAQQNIIKETIRPIYETLNSYIPIHNEAFEKMNNNLNTIVSSIDSAANLMNPLVDSIRSLANNLIPAISSLSNVSEYLKNTPYLNLNRLSISSIKSIKTLEFPEISSVINNLNCVAFNISDLVSPIIENIGNISATVMGALSTSISQINNTFSELDFSFLTYHFIWTEKHDLLVKFGWFYINELPEKIIDSIYDKRETITNNEIDEIILTYFRESRCQNLKNIVNKWNSSIHFISRKRVFHEALVNHSRKYFNSSTTMLTLHTEGIITDYMRLALETPKFNVKKALQDLCDKINEDPLDVLSMSEWRIYNHVLEDILDAFKENFDCANPDNSSNNSRHKIAHGHAVEAETEKNSLKKFLYLNEFFRLFSKIEAESNCNVI